MKHIVKCAVNERQVVIALTGGELVYFEMDPVGLVTSWGIIRQFCYISHSLFA